MADMIDQAAPQMSPSSPAIDEVLAWLDRAATDGVTRAEARAVFDRLPPVEVEEMAGRWVGSGLPTGHRFDGLLEAFGWYGKEYDRVGNAHPLLFGDGANLVAVDPRWLPVRTFGGRRIVRSPMARTAFKAARKLLSTTRPQARLKMVAYRGVATAAMIYDRQPIVDLFRRLTPDMLLGLMDMRGERPFFFTLRKADAPPPTR